MGKTEKRTKGLYNMSQVVRMNSKLDSRGGKKYRRQKAEMIVVDISWAVPVCIETKVFQALKALLSHRPDAKQHAMMGISVWSFVTSRFKPVQENLEGDLGLLSSSGCGRAGP